VDHERRQGKAPGAAGESAIVDHADVRRMLLTMRAHIEAIRGIAYLNGEAVDLAKVHPDAAVRAAAQERAEILTPITKGWGTDLGVEMTSLAVQVHGGMGYIEETGVAQHYRDIRIAPIYEGTNGIQAMDLVGRKLAQGGGANLQAFGGDVGKFVAKHGEHAKLGAEVKSLGAAQAALTRSAMKLLTWFQTGQLEMVPLVANRFLEMMSELAVAWIRTDRAEPMEVKAAE